VVIGDSGSTSTRSSTSPPTRSPTRRCRATSPVGPYKVWAHVDDINQDSTEVDLMVFEHAPGEGQRVGAVWRACRALEPISWDSLRNYTDYGDPSFSA
jgi:hypothetical protein